MASIWSCICATSRATGIPPAVIRGPRRDRETVTARHLACYLARQEADLSGNRNSYPKIAAKLGLFDHTSAMHAVRRAEQRLLEDEGFALLYSAARDELSNAPARHALRAIAGGVDGAQILQPMRRR